MPPQDIPFSVESGLRPPSPIHVPGDVPESCKASGASSPAGLRRPFSDLVKDLAQALNIHPTLREAMSKIYAYRGDVQGVAHGQTQPSLVTMGDAEFILHATGASIVYLCKRGDEIGKDAGN